MKSPASRRPGARLLPVLAGLTVLASRCPADVRLPAILGDNMVLQQQAQAAIWGWADHGEKVAVTLDGKRAEATPDSQGKWLARIPTPRAGGPYELVVEGKNTIVLKNVLIGEVWLCSGQSNMQSPLSAIPAGQSAAAKAASSAIRLFVVPPWMATKPLADLPEGKWVECTPATALRFSAVGYFFARDLQRARLQPVGMIQSAFGGTAIGHWMNRKAIETLPELKKQYDWQQAPANRAGFSQAVDTYEAELAGYRQALAEKRTPMPPAPVKAGYPGWGGFYTGVYNAMIAPILPFTLRGALWYQGEAHYGTSGSYAVELPALIGNWRAAWGNENLVFLIVQLPQFAPPSQPWDWTLVRDAQLKTAMTVPNTGLAVTIDVGDPANLHPANKEPVGQRLALAAEAVAYGMDVPFSGPLFDALKRDPAGRLRLSFKHVYGGLTTPENQPLTGFEVAGADGHFRPAAARVAGKDVIVSCQDVPEPIAVRYGWANDPRCNLFNQEHLPASPFAARL